MAQSKVEATWKKLFHDHSLLQEIAWHGFARITAKAINQAGHEARLMTKFDSYKFLPQLFRDNGLAILPDTRGSYVIGPFEAYAPLFYPQDTPLALDPPPCESLSSTDLYSEASALAFAFNTGIFHHVLGSKTVYATVNGRMTTGDFAFSINCTQGSAQRIQVQKAQIEIDGGYESPQAFCLVEAKNFAPDDFLVRQLYYPYRHWSGKVSKPVVCLFLVYSANVFTLFKYGFGQQDNYSSLELQGTFRFQIPDLPITRSHLATIWKQAPFVPDDPAIPFPQANSLSRVIDLLGNLARQAMSKAHITQHYEFVGRQSDYYLHACGYLGLIEASTAQEDGITRYSLSRSGQELMKQTWREQVLGLAKRLLSHGLYREAFAMALRCPSLTSAAIVPLFSRTDLGLSPATLALAPSTHERRASTVCAWVHWLLDQASDSPYSLLTLPRP